MGAEESKYSKLSVSSLIILWHKIKTQKDKTELINQLSLEKVIKLILELKKEDRIFIIDHYQSLTYLISTIYIDDIVEIVRDLDEFYRDKIYSCVSFQKKEEIIKLLQKNEQETGGIMNSQYIALFKNINVKRAIEFIRYAVFKENIQELECIYIINSQNVLLGLVSFKKLLMSNDDIKIDNLIQEDIVFVYEHEKKEKVVAIFKEHNFSSIPVVDKNKKLIGTICLEDSLDILEEQTTSEIYQSQGIFQNKKAYIYSSSFEMFLKRMPWLITLLVAGTFTTNVLNLFSSLFVSAPFLVLFTQVITQTGGNTGTQSSTLVIRSLALNEITFKHFFVVFSKELKVSSMLGLSLGIFIFFRTIFIPPVLNYSQAFIVAFALFIVIIASSLIGGMVPMIISFFKLDPALIANPLMSTIIDLLGITVYFSVANFILFKIHNIQTINIDSIFTIPF